MQENWEGVGKNTWEEMKTKVVGGLLGTYYDANLLIGSENNWKLILLLNNVGLIQEEWE